MSLQANLDDAYTRLQRGDVNEAVRIYSDILGDARQQPDALYMLGAIAFKIGAMEQALEFAETLTEGSPRYARGWVLKALSLRAMRQVDESLTTARYALELDPQLPDAWECAGMALMHRGKWAEARSHFEMALEYVPENAALHGAYALVLAEQGELIGAWNECRESLMRNPDTPIALMAKTTILAHGGYYDLALRCCRMSGRHERISRSMAFGETEISLAIGRFTEGYSLLAARDSADEDFHYPDWDGREDRAKRVILYSADGASDIFQFIRFASRVVQRTGEIVLRVPIEMERLLRSSFPDLRLSVYRPSVPNGHVSESDPLKDIPKGFDAVCALTRLPYLLRIAGDTGVRQVPYLQPEAQLMTQWRGRLSHIPKPRIGLVWSGDSTDGVPEAQGIPFDDLAALIERFGPHLISMQQGPERAMLRGVNVYDAAPFIRDYADMAALIAEVDLVITISAPAAHLAGAMGKPVWLALPFNADWRWLVAREDSPWYPSARLFRQPQPGNWVSVVNTICNQLERHMDGDPHAIKAPRWKGGFLMRHPDPVPLPGVEDEPGFTL